MWQICMSHCVCRREGGYEFFLENKVAAGILADIIGVMSKNFIICSVLRAGSGLNSLLLRRLAR